MSETRTPKQIAADKVAELIERLEKAEGPSRELDADIYEALGYEIKRRSEHIGTSRHRRTKAYSYLEDSRWLSMERLTASLDAAVALAERLLTRLDLLEITYQIGGTKQHCTVETEDGEFDGINRPTLPLAICLATLKAVRAHMHPRDREEQNDG